jgi:hypothetical protein
MSFTGEACDIINTSLESGISTSQMEDFNHRTGTESEKFNQM